MGPLGRERKHSRSQSVRLLSSAAGREAPPPSQLQAEAPCSLVDNQEGPPIPTGTPHPSSLPQVGTLVWAEPSPRGWEAAGLLRPPGITDAGSTCTA